MYPPFDLLSEKEHGVEVEVLSVDFTAGRPIYETIAEFLKGKDIGVLGG